MLAPSCVLAALTWLTRHEEPRATEFVPIGAIQNMAVFGQPPLSQVPEELPAHALGVRRLANNGYAWRRGDRSVCVLMTSGSGGCFASFPVPAIMFLSGTSRSGEQLATRVEGVVPDTVASLDLVLGDCERISPAISGNSFQEELPLGAAIMEVDVTLTNGEVTVVTQHLG